MHDGEFFKSAACAYDLIYDWDGWTEKDRENIEQTMRFYMEYIDAMTLERALGDRKNVE